MWDWIWMGLLIFFLFIILEESVYFLWNRYVYGRKERKQRRWNNRNTLGIDFLTRLHVKEKWQKFNRKVRSH
ncbi:hypothetical protein V7124_02450 [Neobacillus niacini]|uniref:hypothetical protein n=1 Tax=Neobacillus niacini TaxID=86668 RepID=UPI002FFD6EEB